MKAALSPTLTRARLCVLKHVRDNAGHWASGFGVAVIHCWKLGWIDAAKNEHGQMIGHQITDTGLAVLSQRELIDIVTTNRFPLNAPFDKGLAAIND